MKILYYSSTFFADCDFPLIKALQEKGEDVTYLIALTPYSLNSTLFNIKEQLPENEIVPALRYPELHVYAHYMNFEKVYIANFVNKKDSSFQSLCLNVKIAQFIYKGKFDVIHSDCIHNMWGWMLQMFFRKKFVLTVHDPFPHTGETTGRKAMNYVVAISCAREFVLLNEVQKDDFSKKYKIALEHISINRLGVYDCTSLFGDATKKRRKNNVLFFGRISPYKGLEYLCEAMVKVRKAIPDTTLTIAGSGKMYFDIEAYQRYDWVEVYNRYTTMDELANLLRECSLSVCPYTDATQSGVVMTCYGMSVPVIASNVGGFREQIEDGKTGLLVPPKDTDSLANAIIELLQSEAKLDDMRSYIQDVYLHGDKSWSSIADKYIDVYRKIL
jgi:glycosyltransferase involved in cell wall biosynthesis